MNLFELEKKMIPQKRWNEAPTRIREKLNEISEKIGPGTNIGIGFERHVGWFIMILEGQQPRLEWSEHALPESDFIL